MSKTKKHILLFLLYPTSALLISILFRTTKTDFLNYPAISEFSYWLAILQLLLVIIYLQPNYIASVVIGLICAFVYPLLSSFLALILFDKGSGFLGNINPHLIAHIILYTLTILTLLISENTILWFKKEKSAPTTNSG